MNAVIYWKGLQQKKFQKLYGMGLAYPKREGEPVLLDVDNIEQDWALHLTKYKRLQQRKLP